MVDRARNGAIRDTRAANSEQEHRPHEERSAMKHQLRIGLATLAALSGCGVDLNEAPAPAAVAASPRIAPAATGCMLDSPPSRIKHVIYVQFDNVHFRRDNPNVPSDLEQMPHLLDFITDHGTLLSNHHTPLISHTGGDIMTSLTGVYPDRHGLAVSNAF